MKDDNKATYPAFPVSDPKAPPSDFEWVQGLNKRELFAAMAMKGLWSNSQTFGPLLQQNPRAVAQWAVESADALLAELAKS